MSDLIRREDAIKAVEECLKLLARPRYTVKTAIEAIPSVDIPHSDDWEKYSDKLWKIAYERGKAGRPQGWIPCSEREPNEFEDVLVLLSDGTRDVLQLTDYLDIWGNAKWCHTVNYGMGYSVSSNDVVAWMPLPEPWKGADDEADNN